MPDCLMMTTWTQSASRICLKSCLDVLSRGFRDLQEALQRQLDGRILVEVFLVPHKTLLFTPFQA